MKLLFKATKKRRFTLAELIVTITIFGLLLGLAVPKFLGMQRDAEVATLYRDIDTLEKVIVVYNTHNDTLPISEKVTVDGELLKEITASGDSATELYKVDLTKTSKYHTKLKHGYSGLENDYFIYSKETGRVFYAKGVMNGDGKIVYGYTGTIRYVLLGEQQLSSSKMNIVSKQNDVLVGEVPQNEDVTVKVNGQNVDVTYENVVVDDKHINIFAGENQYKRFKAQLNLNKNDINKIEIRTSSAAMSYIVKVKEYNTNVDLTKYNGVIYVDSLKGNNQATGTKDNPVKTIDKAVALASNGYAIKLAAGNYTLNVGNQGKDLAFIGEKNNTTLYVNNSYFIGINKIEVYDLTLEYDPNLYSLTYNLSEFYGYNIVIKTSGNRVPFTAISSQYNNYVYLENCTVDVDVNTAVFYGEEMNATVKNTVTNTNYWYKTIDLWRINTFNNITSEYRVTYDTDYMITSIEWQNVGTGTNPDGSKANLGVYGGKYSW